jgi:molybdopterin-guanine dinucleotide biosynthesis adapter protein
MAHPPIPLVAFAGRSKVGKTTLIERLIPVLRRMGLRVAVIKHHLHDFEMDIPGKDTYRYKRAGAKITILASPNKIAMVEDTDRERELDEIVRRHVRDVDLVIAEGYKRDDMPKIEVFQRKEGGEKPVCWEDKNLIALVTDEELEAPFPVFRRENVEGVARFIFSRFIGGKDS